ncbi:uncharacterized protein [Drosophila pseudoobscura]|uniref:THAP-type domain-containing protein n=1 Tax=Drosophila pseudoobscura pseudoobscura TaxID=46245 RepID=A0A6I8VPX6_DROPS|nr:uncharacterized protein LOC117183333 [Drosophila pseudoobscura]XP_033232799.1 uncharacterized protein LOC117183333 [Drosophila pseudoobscura]
MSYANQKDTRKSGYKCIIPTCLSGYRKSSANLPVKLFKFPSDPLYFNKWVEVCGLDKNLVKKSAHICVRHFKAEDIGMRKLKSKSIPALKLSDNTPLNQLHEGFYDENSFSGNAEDNEPIENPMKSEGIKLAEVHNNISIELQQESETETPDKDPLENNELNSNIYGENSCSGNALYNEPIEKPMKSKRINPTEVHNTISNKLEQRSEKDTPDVDPLKNNESNDVKCCKNCVAKDKNEAYFTRKYFELLAEKEKKEEDINKWKRRYASLKQSISRANAHRRRKTKTNSNLSVLPIIANMSHVSAEAKTICIMLLKKSQIFSPPEKVIAQNLNFYSKRTYEYLRDVLNLHLPANITLDRWSERFGSGFTPKLLGPQSPKKVV